MGDEIKKYPAEYTVNWPSGPVCCCEKHAGDLKWLGEFLGHYILVQPYFGEEQCQNCINVAKQYKK